MPRGSAFGYLGPNASVWGWRALLADQELLLDEPMNGLDPAGILEMHHDACHGG